jgi:D-alanyl-D-alanine carboxypeptidase
MGKNLTELTSYMLQLAEALLAKSKVAGIALAVIDTGRTPAQQQVKLAQNVSWVTRSKHEPQPPEMLSEAIDVCPLVLLNTKLWSPGSPLWQQVGQIGESLGLRWGGRWVAHPDMGHFEYVHPIQETST